MNQLRFPNQVKKQKGGDIALEKWKPPIIHINWFFNGTWSKFLSVDIFIPKSSYKIIEPKSSLAMLFS